MKNTYQETQALLARYGVILTGEQLIALSREINLGECYLDMDNGAIARITDVATVHIYYRSEGGKTFKLRETMQLLPDGSKKQRNLPVSVSEKIRFGESSMDAIIRGIFEELSLSVKSSALTKLPGRIERRQALSYPGLACVYHFYEYRLIIKSSDYRPEGYVDNDPETGIAAYFNWQQID